MPRVSAPSVLTQNFSFGPKWIAGIIESVTGPVSYEVMLGDGRLVRRHVNQILAHHQRPERGNEKQDRFNSLKSGHHKRGNMAGG